MIESFNSYGIQKEVVQQCVWECMDDMTDRPHWTASVKVSCDQYIGGSARLYIYHCHDVNIDMRIEIYISPGNIHLIRDFAMESINFV
jgi:hypothetical protein